MSKIKRALEFATRKHEEVNQFRKYTNEPYITHPVEVAKIVESVGGSVDMVCAALLHDTVEDTNTSIREIEKEFGIRVASYVDMLTDVSLPGDGNRALRKEIDRKHLSKAHPDAKTIKLADLIDNSKSIIKHDPKFAKVYMREKEAMLQVLKEGDKDLYKIASEIVEGYRDQHEP